MDVPKIVALDVEANLEKGRTLLKITRHGNVPNVRYTVTGSVETIKRIRTKAG